MDALQQYGSDSDSDGSGARAKRVAVSSSVRQYTIDAAPDTAGTVPTAGELTQYVGRDQQLIKSNVPYAVLAQPLVGPADKDGDFASKRQQQLASGHAEQQAVSESAFRKQERMSRQRGYASNPSTGAEQEIVGEKSSDLKNNRGLRRKRKGDSAVLDGDNAYQGPWAGYEGEKRGEPVGPTAEQLAEYEERAGKHADAAGPQKPGRALYTAGEPERTTFHGAAERDYQGRTYMHVPAELQHGSPGDQTCVAPKRMVREWPQAHRGGVSAIRFIPDSGHLLLSCGMDGLVKIFDTHTSLRQLRTYIGHSKAVRDVSFAPDGQTFLSASYDTFTKLWDTETGQCRGQFSGKGSVPYVARFYPEDPNLFLVGQGDRRIVQWDMRANEIVQEYNQHLGAVNSLTFFDNNRRFISTSDDKSMRVWEFGIPVVIKLVADPAMHSIPAVTLHPSQKWLVGQSMDNRLVVYSAGERIKPHRRKEFRGHLSAGFACQPSCSPDGRFLVSGDSEGQVWCWDWQTTRVVTRWRAHDKVAIGTAWHPRESSKVATCSWDGSIKYWD
ncbi:hypothetical protein GGF46_003602 [Coemansia sp. RSA 552]|nr:hypothetical protein GGF46_003602 [Coemansia sp. RSA 552]